MTGQVDVCAYSRTSAAEVVALVTWAKAALERQAKRATPSAERDRLTATARTLLWIED